MTDENFEEWRRRYFPEKSELTPFQREVASRLLNGEGSFFVTVGTRHSRRSLYDDLLAFLKDETVTQQKGE